MAESGRVRTLLHAFPTFALGGAEGRLVTLANAFKGRYRHHIVAMDGRMAAADRFHDDVDWQALPFATRYGKGFPNFSACRHILQKLRPDLLITYSWGSMDWVAANIGLGVPHVQVHDGFGPDEVHGQQARRVWTRRLLLGLRGVPVVVPSLTLKRLVSTWWVPARRTWYIPNGVPMGESGAHSALLCARTTLTVGTVAGLRPEKNIARLIKAFAQVARTRPIQLVVVGGGSQLPALQDLAQSLGVAERVEFTGYLEKPLERMRDFDLFALSSDTEQLPIAMLEAMALGIPVVATAVGDVPHVLPAVAHRGLSAVDDAAFTKALEAVLAAQVEWPAWVEAGRIRVREEYPDSLMLQRWADVFDGKLPTLPPEKTLA